MRRFALITVLILALSLIAALPVLAQGETFDDGRLNEDAAAPVVIFCGLTGGIEAFAAVGGDALNLTRAQIEGALAQAVLDETPINVGFGALGTRLIAYPDGGLLVTSIENYQFTIPATACGGFDPDERFIIGLVSDLVEIVDGEIQDGMVVVAEAADHYSYGYSSVSSASGSGQTHTVARGENLYRIGLRYGVHYTDIARANGISNVNSIYAGQVLRIP